VDAFHLSTFCTSYAFILIQFILFCFAEQSPLAAGANDKVTVMNISLHCFIFVSIRVLHACMVTVNSICDTGSVSLLISIITLLPLSLRDRRLSCIGVYLSPMHSEKINSTSTSVELFSYTDFSLRRQWRSFL